MDAITAITDSIRQAVVSGEIAALDDQGRLEYYIAVCESVGLNPLTRPLEYLELNGKLTLYAKRDATDQLRRKHAVSIEIVDRVIQEDVYVVRVRAITPDGRTDESLGAVSVAGLEGEGLANALMKAETKAKRRVALSICGLGLLDETEVEAMRSRPSLPGPPRPETSPDAQPAPTAATILRAWDDRYPTSRELLYAHAKEAYGKRVLALTAAEVLDVLDWISTQPLAPIAAEGAPGHAA